MTPRDAILSYFPLRTPAGHRRRQARHRLLKVAVGLLTIVTSLGLGISAAMAVPPTNDSFSNAKVIDLTALPFGETVDITEATVEASEPQFCSFSLQTIWYKFTTTTSVWLNANTVGGSFPFGTYLTVYRDTGSGFPGLSFVGCSSNPDFIFAVGGDSVFASTYYIQALAPCCGVTGNLRVNVAQVPPPMPVANFYFFPSDPSAFDNVQFFDNSSDPGQVGIQSFTWNFGDGGTTTGCCPIHRFTNDQDYTVQHTVTTFDGRTGSVSHIVSVKTHDVAITRFKVPQTASQGQTKPISVGVRNSRYPETVRVDLYKSTPGGQPFQQVGYLELFVPVRQSNQTTDFNFSYTFTNTDAFVGKVTFRAVASIVGGRDALAADNEAISSPIKVNKFFMEAVGDSNISIVPDRLALLGVMPSGPNAGADLQVRLSLPTSGTAQLQVFDIAGRVMVRRELTVSSPGIHEERVSWDQRPSPGAYWVRLTHAGHSVSKRVAILQ